MKVECLLFYSMTKPYFVILPMSHAHPLLVNDFLKLKKQNPRLCIGVEDFCFYKRIYRIKSSIPCSERRKMAHHTFIRNICRVICANWFSSIIGHMHASWACCTVDRPHEVHIVKVCTAMQEEFSTSTHKEADDPNAKLYFFLRYFLWFSLRAFTSRLYISYIEFLAIFDFDFVCVVWYLLLAACCLRSSALELKFHNIFFFF